MNESTPEPVSPARNEILRWGLGRLVNLGLFVGAGVLLIVLLGIAQRVGWLKTAGETQSSSSVGSAEAVHTCPMHPQIRQPGLGDCPICGMPLVPATAGGADLDEFAVSIEPAQRRLANIKTVTVTEQPVSRQLQTIGSIEIDESRQATISSYIDGRLEKIYADYTGVEVQEGDHLAVVYSPQLYSAQIEYLEAKKTLESFSDSALASIREAQEKLADNSRQRLLELGMTADQLRELDTTEAAKSRLTIYAPMGGTVIEKLAEEGKYIEAGEPIYRIADLSMVWLMLELFPEDASRIRFGQQVQARLSSNPNEVLTGRVAFIAPNVDPSSRTVGVRVEFTNDQRKLRPGDYAEATITIPIGPEGEIYDQDLAGKWISPMHPQIIRDQPGPCPVCGMQLVPTTRYGYAATPVDQPVSVTIPRSALLLAGQNSVAYVETEAGRFELRVVKIGPFLKDNVVILEGIEPGEQVATSGNFLIDSQMQLAGKPSLIDPTRYVRKFRNVPLEFDSIDISVIGGKSGEQLEELYSRYFEIRTAFAADKKPVEESSLSLHELSTQLTSSEDVTDQAKEQLSIVTENAEHLHHLPLEEARMQFKPISHAILELATQIRGEGNERVFRHFFCPMVKEGEGDWLQFEERISNPYYGSQMLRCGELIRTLPPENASSEETPVPADDPTGGDAEAGKPSPEAM
ncbi:MAG: efflux RND transporter periplasmic adaptor subunit [Planctomycetota bacterium]|nr:efflux RND transporter periplasmic adaptor subunit [Planctomycetota bacterium]